MNEGGNCNPIKCPAVKKPWLAKPEKVREVGEVEYNKTFLPSTGEVNGKSARTKPEDAIFRLCSLLAV